MMTREGMLDGKVAIVTGGGRDIGRACAERLAEEGAAIAINYHASAEGGEAAVAAIEGAGGRAFAMQGDMTDPDAVAALVERAVAEFGGLDILVNNTGGLVARRKIADMSLDHWRTVMDLNLTSVFLLVNASLVHLREGGAIVNIASQAGRDGGGAGAAAYAAAKGAVMTLTRALAKEVGPGIRVNGVCPGMIDTDFHNVFTKTEVRRTVAGNTPLKREGQPEDVAALVAYLASGEAAFLTGTNIDINGGTLFS